MPRLCAAEIGLREVADRVIDGAVDRFRTALVGAACRDPALSITKLAARRSYMSDSNATLGAVDHAFRHFSKPDFRSAQAGHSPQP